MRNKYSFIKNHALEFLFFALIFLLHLFMQYRGNSDDAVFRNAIENKSLIDFLIIRYTTWTSRVILEAVLVMVSQSFFLWQVLDSLICLLLFYSLLRIIPPTSRNNAKVPLFLLLLSYPFANMGSSGWVATTLNYLWPLAFGAYALSVIIRTERKDKDFIETPLQTLLASLAIFAAANAEQALVVIGAIGIALIVYAIKKNQTISRTTLICALLVFADLLIIALCPGNTIRNAHETDYWWPDTTHFVEPTSFADFGVIEKLSLAFSDTFDSYFYGSNLLLMLLALALTLYEFEYKKSTQLEKYSSALTTLLVAAFSFFSLYKVDFWPRAIYALFTQPLFGISARRLLITFVQLFVALSILIQLYRLPKKDEVDEDHMIDRLYLPALYMLGLLSRFIVGFSATILASGWRTTIFLDAIIILLAAIVLTRIADDNKKAARYNLVLYTVLASSIATTTLLSVINIWR